MDDRSPVAPVASAAPLSREDFIHRHLPFNLFAFLVDGAGWWLGMSFFSAETILPYFVRELGGGDLLVGLVPAIFSLGFFLPQIFIAHITERRRSQKRAVMAIAWIERILVKTTDGRMASS